jgi:predicted alpha-1,2-mannosidase
MIQFARCSVRIALFIFIAVNILGCSDRSMPESLHATVNPFIGTGGHGHTYPGATVPFGMVQLSPDSRLDGWDGCGGYHYSDSMIYGFSHTHLQGTGVSDYGDILIMPCTQFRADAETWADRYKSRFDHEQENAHAGYYNVQLQDHGVDAELTTTERVGIHRYRLNEPDTLTLIIDLQHRDELIHYSIEPLNDSTLVGHRLSDNWAREQHVYFAMRFDQSFEWQDQLSEIQITDTLDDGTLLQTVEYVPVFACDFGVIEELNVRLALSFVDIDGALNNLTEEAPRSDFDFYRQQAEALWEEQLQTVTVDGGTADEQAVFYTALYHSFTTPNVASDVDGRYRGTDLSIHQLTPEEGLHYTVFSLWDTFRALHPLLNWLEPQRSRDFVRTMLRMHEHGGQLPVWELAGNYTGCMIGYHSVPVIQDAVSWGIDGFDQEQALKAMLQAADSAHLGLPSYQAYGYIPLDEEHESVSKTLEYAYDDACIAAFARQMPSARSGDDQVVKRFTQRALFYRNLFNSSTNFIQPKRGGAWLEDFEPREVNFNYTEANGWQYNFFTPQDINGHIALMGGDSVYFQMLERMFTSSSETTGRQQPDITGMIGQYAHGNEPSHHMAYLYPFVGNTSRTAELVRQIRNELYPNAPDGLSGNEDCGQMSAWYVWSALGLYPVTPGSNQIIAGIPAFETATVQPRPFTGHKANPLTIDFKNPGHYIAGWTLNGTKKTTSWISKVDLKEGGTLQFHGAEHASEFGADRGNRPTEKLDDSDFVSVPVIHAPRTFQSLQTFVTITNSDPEVITKFRVLNLDQSESNAPWQVYRQPIELKASQRIEAFSENILGNISAQVSHRVRQISHRHALQLSEPFDPQYAAGGAQALIDGIHGNAHYQTGDWQGFWGKDVTATVDLGESKMIQTMSMGALRDIRPWIFLPRSVTFSCSRDGVNWETIETVSHRLSDEDDVNVAHRFVSNRSREARYWRAEVQHYGDLPAGHLGAGNPSWVFLDEFELSVKSP